MIITLKDILHDSSLFEDGDVIYAKKIDGKFCKDSQLAILHLTEEEKDLSIAETIVNKCPGLDYFIQGDILNDLIYDLELAKPPLNVDEMADSVILYVEFNV